MYAFQQAEKYDAAELNGRQLLDSSLKRMSPRHNETNNNLAFTSLLFFFIKILNYSSCCYDLIFF